MSNTIIRGTGLTGEVAEGEAMVSDKAFGFAHGIDPYTGEITDTLHEWGGQNAKGKVLVFPYGKGSSTGGSFVLESIKMGNAPAAVINIETDPVAATGFIIGALLYDNPIPVVHRLEQNPIEAIKNGDRVKVDAINGTVEIFK